MKFYTEIEINLSRQKVIELFDSAENLSKWQPELISFDHLKGKPGEVGAKSSLKYKMGTREVEMIETITKKDLPNEFNGTYEARGVFNEINNRFIELDANRTKWVAENVFKFSGIMSIVSIFMRNAFKKQSMKYMEQFKDFAEGEWKNEEEE